MEILFTRSNSPLSRIIRHLTKEPVSHCAISINGWIIHSNLYGIHADPIEKFTSEVIYRVPVEYNAEALISALAAYQGKHYDFGALLYLGLRSVCPVLPKKNLWQTTGMFLCTEWVTTVLDEKEDSMITPYQLYLKLKDRI